MSWTFLGGNLRNGSQGEGTEIREVGGTPRTTSSRSHTTCAERVQHRNSKWLFTRSRVWVLSAFHTVLSQLPRTSTMDPKLLRPKRQDNTLSSLNAAIEAMNLAKEVLSLTPAKAVFGTVSIVLTTIRVRFPSSPMIHSRPSCDQDSTANESDYVELGLTCANVCKTLHRGMDGKKLDNLSQSVLEAIEQLAT